MPDESERIIFQGLWEDLLRHGSKLAGKRVRLTLLNVAGATLPADVARQWAEESERLTPEPGPEVRGIKGELRRLLMEKYRRQGLRF